MIIWWAQIFESILNCSSWSISFELINICRSILNFTLSSSKESRLTIEILLSDYWNVIESKLKLVVVLISFSNHMNWINLLISFGLIWEIWYRRLMLLSLIVDFDFEELWSNNFWCVGINQSKFLASQLMIDLVWFEKSKTINVKIVFVCSFNVKLESMCDESMVEALVNSRMIVDV